MPAGGFLNVHTDFLSHTRRHDWSRQINLLLYFNEGWQSSWNGNLELWDADGKRSAQGDVALREASDRIRQGAILAVKGIGGFHLVTDA